MDHDVKINIPIAKVDQAKRLVTGIVLEPDSIDSQNDTVSADVIEVSAHDFLAKYNKMTQMGLMHTIFGQIGVSLVESYVAPVDFELNGKPVKKGSWIMTTKIHDDQLWNKVQNGEITGYSIGGVATLPAD